MNWEQIIKNKEVKAYVCTSIVTAQDDALSREGQYYNTMWFAVVIINIVGVITPWSCTRLRHELVGQCDTIRYW